MSRAERLARHPRGWPLRWRLAAVSAGLTMVILIVFAIVIGRLAQERIQDDFEEDLQNAAGQIATEIEVATATGGTLRISGADLEKMAMADAAVVRILTADGEVLIAAPANADLGTPTASVRSVGELSVASAPVITNSIGAPQRFVQYARDRQPPARSHRPATRRATCRSPTPATKSRSSPARSRRCSRASTPLRPSASR
jgi:hypothetical protein